MSNETQSFNPIGYAMSAVRRLPDKWNDQQRNHRGIRSTFRRWRPDSTGRPTMDMCSQVWSILGAPQVPQENESDEERTKWLANLTVDRAAVIVALRAVAGENDGAPIPLGAALFRAELSDRRFAQLVTAPKSMRLEALHRTMRLVERSGAVIDWGRETRNIYYFLFGQEEQKKRAVDVWAGDFFRTRAKDAQNEETAEPETTDKE